MKAIYYDQTFDTISRNLLWYGEAEKMSPKYARYKFIPEKEFVYYKNNVDEFKDLLSMITIRELYFLNDKNDLHKLIRLVFEDERIAKEK